MEQTIFIIGAGAVGRSLGASLVDKGALVIGLYDKHDAKIFDLASELSVAAYLGDDPPDVTAKADLVLVAVPETQVPEVAERAAVTRHFSSSQIWLHVSGSLSAKALGPLESQVAGVGTLHPALVFPPSVSTMIPMGTSFTFDGDEQARQSAIALVNLLEGRFCELKAGGRGKYHAALVLGSNYQAALLVAAQRLLLSCGLSAEESERLLTGLAQSAIDNLAQHGLAGGLSGPLRRGDGDTVRRHIEELGEFEEIKQLYGRLGLVLLEMLDQSHLISGPQSRDLQRILGEALNLSGAGEPQDD